MSSRRKTPTIVPTSPREELTVALQQESQMRADRAAQTIGEILDKEQVNLVGIPSFTPDGRVVVTIRVVDRLRT